MRVELSLLSANSPPTEHLRGLIHLSAFQSQRVAPHRLSGLRQTGTCMTQRMSAGRQVHDGKSLETRESLRCRLRNGHAKLHHTDVLAIVALIKNDSEVGIPFLHASTRFLGKGFSPGNSLPSCGAVFTRLVCAMPAISASAIAGA